MTILNKIFGRFNDLALLPVRVALFWIFFAHGGQLLFGWWHGPGILGFSSMMESLGLKPAMLWALLASGSQFFGAIMVLLGLFTRLGAFLLTMVMIVAIATVHAKNGFFLSNSGYEYNVAILGLTLCLLFKGAGPYSLKD